MDKEVRWLREIDRISDKLTNLRKMNERDDLSDGFKAINDEVMTELALRKKDLVNKVVDERLKGYE